MESAPISEMEIVELNEDTSTSSISSRLSASSRSISTRSRGQKRKPTSVVWDYFTATTTEKIRVVRCNQCGISYNNPQGTSTLKKYLKKHHGLFEEKSWQESWCN